MVDEKLSWKEKFAAVVIMGIGVLLIILLVMSVVSSQSSVISDHGNTFTIRKSELLNYIRFVLTIILAISGGILLFRQRKWGWIIGVPFLLFSSFLAGYFIWFLYVMGLIPSFIVSIFVFLVLVLALAFLLLPDARKKYKVGNHTWLPTLVFLAAIGALYFFLQ